MPSVYMKRPLSFYSVAEEIYLRGFKVCSDGAVAFNWPEYGLTRSQDLPEFYHDAGQFYWVNVGDFKLEKRLIIPETRPVVLPRKLVQDTDTPEDWEAAELMAQVLLKEQAS